MKPENVTCPECRGPMVSRLNSRTQQRFWGCKDFPRCKGTRDTDGNSRYEQYGSRREQEYTRAEYDDTLLPSERTRQNDRGRHDL